MLLSPLGSMAPNDPPSLVNHVADTLLHIISSIYIHDCKHLEPTQNYSQLEEFEIQKHSSYTQVFHFYTNIFFSQEWVFVYPVSLEGPQTKHLQKAWMCQRDTLQYMLERK